MSNQNTVTREECEEILEEVKTCLDCRYIARENGRAKVGDSHYFECVNHRTSARLARAHLKLLDKSEQIAKAAKKADWQQVVLNGGPPCFHVDDNTFCLRAERWLGHGDKDFHKFTSLEDLMRNA